MIKEKKTKSVKLAKPTVQMGQSTIIPARDYTLMGGEKIAYNPDTITLETYNEMRKYPTIAGALDVIKLPIISVDWYIESSDERKKKFVDKVLRNLWAGFIRDFLTAYDFGFSAFEKVFDYNEDSMIILKKLFSLSPFYTKILRTDDVSFNGVLFSPMGASSNDKINLSAQKSFVFTYKKEFENMYGAPRTRGAYTAWYIARYILEFTNIFYEKYSSPQLIGYAPTAKIKYQGKDVEATTYLLDVLKSMQNASATVLPHTGGKRDELKYHIEVLESQRTGGDFINYLKYLDNQMFTGAGIPPLAYSAGEKGSYSLFETQQALFAQGVDGDLTVIKQHIDNYIIKPLVAMNFPNADKDDTRWVYQSLANRDKELTRQIMLALVQAGKVDVATKYLSDALGMPMIETGKLLEETKAEVNTKENVATGQANQTKMARKKDVKRYDDKINYERIEKQYNDNEELIIGGVLPILTKQKIKIIDSIQKSIKNPSQIGNMDLSFKSEYEGKIVEVAKKIFDDGVKDVKAENKLRVELPAEAKAWVTSSSKNIADKHLNDLKFSVVSAALLAISKELSEKEILYNVGQAFDKYTNISLADSAALMNQKYYSEGREWTATEAGLKYAQWSAVLDNATCVYCESRDGMIIEISDPDFSEFSPGNVHENCRCFTNPRTKIYTLNGWKKIKDIKMGDEVLTHLGRFKKVNHTFISENYKGDRYRIQLSKSNPKECGVSVSVTPEHPFMVKRNNQWLWIETKDLKEGDIIKYLGKKCKKDDCNNLTRYDKNYCSRSCLSKIITKKQWANPIHKKNVSKKNSLNMIKQYETGMRDGNDITKMAHIKTREMVKFGNHPFQNPLNIKKSIIANAKSKHGSFSEKKVGWLIEQLGYEFKKQYMLNKGKDKLGRERYYYLDFGNPELKIAIEVDGEYWHSKRKEQDYLRDKILQEKGWTVLRLPSKLVKENLKECSERIQRVYQNHTHQEQFVELPIKKIIKKTGGYFRRYNLSVEDDNSYVANGIVVHNCMWIYINSDTEPEGDSWRSPSKSDVKNYYN